MVAKGDHGGEELQQDAVVEARDCLPYRVWDTIWAGGGGGGGLA